MENCKNYIQVSDAGNYFGHSGIGRILLAYELQTTVDCWGSIPYSQAFQGTGNIDAKYDSDVSVYAAITQLVYDGINKLNQNAQTLAGNQPGPEDFIYNGNMGEWIKFGNAILARIFIHQSKGNAAMADSAMAHAALSFASNADNARLVIPRPQLIALGIILPSGTRCIMPILTILPKLLLVECFLHRMIPVTVF